MIPVLSALLALAPWFLPLAVAMDVPCPLDPHPTRARVAYGFRLALAVVGASILSVFAFVGAYVSLSIGSL
jgi:hypothetical protein